MPRPMPPHAASEDRLYLGGSLVFCSAVIVQLLQVTLLTPALWVALWSAAIATPCLVAMLFAYVYHERYVARHMTGYTLVLGFFGYYGTIGCAGAVFWHFSWHVGACFGAMAFLATLLYGFDLMYHQRINAPQGGRAYPCQGPHRPRPQAPAPREPRALWKLS